jgi:hypothetical protein
MRVHREWGHVHVFGQLVLWFARRLREGEGAKNNGSAPLHISMIRDTIREDVPRAELYGFPSRARTNLSSLLNENRRTANIRSNSS